ncbi:PUTATIVE CONTAINS TWO ABC TRANSPORTER PERMEASE DOMAINS PROTEIN [Mesorhizobium loti]|nr:PUTATIVE CONTAINS TWO ABC TRANSPORTER PERMEASE DOMAINS PROTEIN [Mesorhizobium loti]
MDSLTCAAASLGASPAQNFWRMFFLISAPGVRAAGLLLFVFALEFYITPSLLGDPNTIVPPKLMNATPNWPLAATVATVLLAITLVLYAISNYFVGIEPLLGSQRGAGQSAGSTLRHSTSAYLQLVDLAPVLVRAVGGSVRFPAGLTALGGKLLWDFSVIVAVFLLVSPILIIVQISSSSSRFLDFPPPGLSVQWYDAYVTSEAWVSATFESLAVAISIVFARLAPGLAAAIGFVRGSRRMRRVGYQLLLAPLIALVIISAVAIYFLFEPLQLANTYLALATSHSIEAVPLVVLIVVASLQAQNIRLEHVALSLSASRLVTISPIVLLFIRPALIIAGFFAFRWCVSGPGTMALPGRCGREFGKRSHPRLLRYQVY